MLFSKNDAHGLITAPHAVEFLPYSFPVVQPYAMLCTPTVEAFIHPFRTMYEVYAIAPQMDTEQRFNGTEHGSLATAGQVVVEFGLAAPVVSDHDLHTVFGASHGWRLRAPDTPPEASMKQVILIALLRESDRIPHGMHGPLAKVGGNLDVNSYIFHNIENMRKFSKIISNIIPKSDFNRRDIVLSVGFSLLLTWVSYVRPSPILWV